MKFNKFNFLWKTILLTALTNNANASYKFY